MLQRRLALLLLALAAFTAIVGACGDGGLAPSAEADSGSAPAAVGEGICPRSAPAPSAACVLPEGTTCAFGACGTPIAQCIHGAWLYGGNPPPRPPCPDPAPPAPESACPPCWPADVTCRYGSEDCSSADASANRTVASCPNGVWLLEFSPCAAPPPPARPASGDGGADADAADVADAAAEPADADSDDGADVQGDAEADAD
jgi:hypothetical protein